MVEEIVSSQVGSASREEKGESNLDAAGALAQFLRFLMGNTEEANDLCGTLAGLNNRPLEESDWRRAEIVNVGLRDAGIDHETVIKVFQGIKESSSAGEEK